jgi:hypothetical protein
MITRVEKIGPGSWAAFVDGQRHHELFLTRAAARRFMKETKQQNKEVTQQATANEAEEMTATKLGFADWKFPCRR